MKECDFDKLNFMRVFTPMHIPKTLIEQIKHKNFTVDDWYRHQLDICTVTTDKGPQLNPASMLYVITDEKYKVVGCLWCEVNDLENALVVQTFSMDKEYWCRGKAVYLLAKKAKEIANQCNLKKIYTITRYPKHAKWYGFHESKDVLMEWVPEEQPLEEKQDGKDNDGEHIQGCHGESLQRDTVKSTE